MKKMLFWGALLFAGIILTGCGGGSSDDTTTQGGDGAVTSGFTTDILNGAPTFYVSYAGDPDGTTDQGTTQEEIAFTGSDGTYQVTVTQEYFDASNVSQGSTTLTVNVTLNQDGTLTASVTGEPSSTTYTLENSTADYFLVSGVNGADTWSDYWYVAKPAGWLNGSAVVDGFTADMLNGDPTFYLSYAGDSDGTTDQGTTQEEIAFTGSDGTYQFTVTSEYFDASNVSQGSTTSTGNVTLNQDGTLTVTETGDPQPQTITLDNSTADYLLVTGVSGTDTWTDHWYFAKPADWLTGSGEPLAFSAADFNDSVVYEIWEESGGPLGAGGWAGTTIQFNSNGTATGAAGIVDPFVAEFTGATWGIDAGGRLHISAGSENYFTLTARTADYFAVCWGETAAEADGCTYPEYLFTDSAAANAFVATAP